MNVYPDVRNPDVREIEIRTFEIRTFDNRTYLCPVWQTGRPVSGHLLYVTNTSSHLKKDWIRHTLKQPKNIVK